MEAGGHLSGYGSTHRTDTWWIGPAATAAGLSAWLLYYFWAAWQGENYTSGPYISPFYSPLMYADPALHTAAMHHAWFSGTWFAWWPSFVPKSPALLIGFLPGLFRITCYYYRKAYYRAFFGTPPGCGVGPRPENSYKGETFLLLFQNLHRYTLYIAIALLPFLYYDAALSWSYHGKIGVGVGTIMVTMNAILLTGYTMGCHAWRHLVGGRLNCFSCGSSTELRFRIWGRVTKLNVNHMQWAWASLIWIAVTDMYIRACATGLITDLNTWGA